jgi:sialate O-acetylesterase
MTTRNNLATNQDCLCCNFEPKKQMQTIMKTFILIILTLLIATSHGSCTTNITNNGSTPSIEPVLTLDGSWKFNIGDDEDWARKNYDDTHWDSLRAPGSWQNQGYVGYYGYAWYRRTISIAPTSASDQLYLHLGQIDDVNEVYFNGVHIGQTGNFPPEYETAYNIPVVYPIPKDLIQFDAPNTIAIRVFDSGRDGGIISGPLSIGFYEDERLLNQNLSGDWKISFDFNRRYLNEDYDDDEWLPIHVPATWESQGFTNYNGTASYRKIFEIDRNIQEERLYLILGKIDDKDRVYLNGRLIGKTEDMYKTALGNRDMGDWQIRRAYRIPEQLLNFSGPNILVVMVEDIGGNGGIFEGPIGIMTEDNCLAYIREHRSTVLYRNFYPFRSY